MLIVGLTGASGSGKGYLSSLLVDSDIRIIDTDLVYHKMISSPTPCVEALISVFGEVIRDDNGGINRAALGDIVFSSKERLEQLNSIAHSFIRKKCNEIIESGGAKIVILDAPVLFESGFDDMCDVTVGVVANEDIRLARITKRDGISREKAYARIRNQHSDDWFRDKCDIVIENDGAGLKGKAEELKIRLMRLYGEKEKKKK